MNLPVPLTFPPLALVRWEGACAPANGLPAHKASVGSLDMVPDLSPPRTSAYASLSAASPGARTTGCWPPAVTLQHISIPISSLWASISLIGRNLKSHRKNGFLSSLERGATAWMDLAFRLAGGSAAHLAWDWVPRWLVAPR